MKDCWWNYYYFTIAITCYYFTIAIMLLVSRNIMVNKCVLGCRSNLHGETIDPTFPTKHEDIKNKNEIY